MRIWLSTCILDDLWPHSCRAPLNLLPVSCYVGFQNCFLLFIQRGTVFGPLQTVLPHSALYCSQSIKATWLDSGSSLCFNADLWLRDSASAQWPSANLTACCFERFCFKTLRRQAQLGHRVHSAVCCVTVGSQSC